MSLFLFQQTTQRLRQCLDAVKDGSLDKASKEEQAAASDLLSLARQYIDTYLGDEPQ